MRWFDSWFRRRKPSDARISIAHFAKQSPTPTVVLSASSPRGSMTIFALPLTLQNDSRTELAAVSLARILGVPLVDERKGIPTWRGPKPPPPPRTTSP